MLAVQATAVRLLLQQVHQHQSTLGTVRYFVAQADFAIPAGAYKQEWEATLSGCKQSFPTAGNTIIVQESP